MKECHNEDAQCAFVVDKILEFSSNHSAANCSYGNIAVLYRRQVMFLDINYYNFNFVQKHFTLYLTKWCLLLPFFPFQISGKAFQMAFRDRKIPFNIHGVAFYRKKVFSPLIKTRRVFISII